MRVHSLWCILQDRLKGGAIKVNDWSLHANIGTVILDRVICDQDIDTQVLTG